MPWGMVWGILVRVRQSWHSPLGFHPLRSRSIEDSGCVSALSLGVFRKPQKTRLKKTCSPKNESIITLISLWWFWLCTSKVMLKLLDSTRHFGAMVFPSVYHPSCGWNSREVGCWCTIKQPVFLWWKHGQKQSMPCFVLKLEKLTRSWDLTSRSNDGTSARCFGKLLGFVDVFRFRPWYILLSMRHTPSETPYEPVI